jgi:hypothetical protein
MVCGVWDRRGQQWVVAGLSAALAVAYLLLPRMGSDLSAQVARAGFFAAHGWTPVDLRWYGGVNQLGYSLVSQPVMATLGARVTGAIALVLTSCAFAALLFRTGAPRPLLGAVIGTLGIAGNLVSGRVTYALGVFFGVLALLLLTDRRLRWVAAAVALLASATSPVAGLFLGLAGVALAVSGRTRRGLVIAVPATVPLLLVAVLFGDGGWMNIGRTDAVRAIVTSLLVVALVPLRPVRVGGLLSAGGVLAAALIHTPVGLNATRLVTMFALPVLAAYAVVPGLRRAASPADSAALPGRTAGSAPAGAASSGAAPARTADSGYATARTADSGALPGRAADSAPARAADSGAATSRAADSGAPARAADSGATSGTAADDSGCSEALSTRSHRRMPVWALVPLLAAVCWWQPPVVVADVADLGNPTADPGYFAPLRDRLAALPLSGRVEIPPTRAYWESAYLGDVPLARGWLRQADIDRNPLFFGTVPGAPGTGVPLTVETYRTWLTEQSVQYVAVPDAELSWVGRPEAALVTGGLPYLQLIWSQRHWRLYAVADPEPIVAPPATLVSHTAAAVTFDAPAGGDVTIRVRHHRWLRAKGAIVEASGEWTVVRVPAPGRYTLTS